MNWPLLNGRCQRMSSQEGYSSQQFRDYTLGKASSYCLERYHGSMHLGNWRFFLHKVRYWRPRSRGRSMAWHPLAVVHWDSRRVVPILRRLAKPITWCAFNFATAFAFYVWRWSSWARITSQIRQHTSWWALAFRRRSRRRSVGSIKFISWLLRTQVVSLLELEK